MIRQLVPVSLLTVAAAFAASQPQPVTGLWDATLKMDALEVPFRFEIAPGGGPGRIVGSFFNGDERVSSTSGRIASNAVVLEFAHYAAKLDAKFEGGELTGAYKRGNYPAYAFHAVRYVAPAETSAPVPDIAGTWDIQAKSGKGESAWRLVVRQSGHEASAVIQRVDGDSGTLTGRYRDGKFLLSHFSGARPSVFEIEVGPDQSLALTQNHTTHYVALRSSEARARGLAEPADPTRWTSVKDPSEPLHFSAKDLNGKVVTETDPRFRGKVVLVSITGSWCPNCHDEAPFLEELYKKYRKQGFEIVALSFEEAEQLRDLTRLKAFIKQYGIDYTVLVAGVPDDVKTVLPQAVNLNTFPASFFLGRDGLVRGSHAGYAGKATGEAHDRLKAELTATVERLLAENVRSAR